MLWGWAAFWCVYVFVLSAEGGGQVRLVSVPNFSRTGTIVLLNLRTLQCHPITFATPMEQ